jgi:hypothetical protein
MAGAENTLIGAGLLTSLVAVLILVKARPKQCQTAVHAGDRDHYPGRAA